jgi:MFS family permease
MPGTSATSEASAGLDRDVLIVAGVVILGAFMSVLDTTVVNVAIERLASVFKAPLTTIQWVVTGYTLALAAVIPVSGWAANRFGAKRIYLISLVLFTAGSAAGWSTTSPGAGSSSSTCRSASSPSSPRGAYSRPASPSRPTASTGSGC